MIYYSKNMCILLGVGIGKLMSDKLCTYKSVVSYVGWQC